MTFILVAIIVALAIMCVMQSGTINELSYRVQNQWKMYEKFDEEWMGKPLTARASHYTNATRRNIQGLFAFWKDVYAFRFDADFLFEVAKIRYLRDRDGFVSEMWNEPENPEDKWRVAINGREMENVEYYLHDGLFATGNLITLEDAVLLVRLQQPADEPSPVDRVKNANSRAKLKAAKLLANRAAGLGISPSRRGAISRALLNTNLADDDDDDSHGFFDQI